MDAYQERLQLFAESYEDFEPSEIIDLLKKTGEWLELALMDDGAVDRIMRVIFGEIGGSLGDADEHTHWRAIFDANLGFEVRSGQFMVSLNAYAYYGLFPDVEIIGRDKEGDPTEAVGAYVARARSFLDAIPPGWGEHDNLTRTVLAAEARWMLDTGQDVSPERLASLARISLKSMRNQMSSQADLKPNEAGELSHSVALRWLQGRSDYLATILDRPDARTSPNWPEAAELGEVLFVPVARDGSWFDPVACRTANGYTIGPKGSEEVVANYRDALTRLSKMATPYWRRPNSAGNRGIVAGVNWVRKAANELTLDTVEGR